jgi:hypothetical protein
MEQRLDATYLKQGPFERGAAVALAAAGIGLGFLLAAWGISSFWRYAPREIAVHISNPEVRIKQEAPLTVSQATPFVLAPPEPIKVEPRQISVKVESPPTNELLPLHSSGGDVIRREVTVFATVSHGPGSVVTGWNYKDGSGGVPVRQFCYYTSPSGDQSSMRVDLAFDGIPKTPIGVDLVPDIDIAISRCQWWRS